MEVDWSPTSGPSGSRHASPFHSAAGGAGSTSGRAGSPTNTSRKRRRSIQPLIVDAAMGSHSDGACSRDRTDGDDAHPLKRLNRAESTTRPEENDASPHYYRPLGAASGLSAMDSDGNEYGYPIGVAGGEGLDYGVDSPMHSLSLLSRSPSAEDTRQYAASNSAAAAQDVAEDVEMGMSSSSSHVDDALINATTATSFVPRQLRKHGLRSIANAPVRPSPLAQQTDGRASSNDSSPSFHRSMERSISSDSSQSSSSYAHRRQTSRSYTIATATQSSVLRRQSYEAETTATNVPLRRASRTGRAMRTPSPRPQPIPREDGETSTEAQTGSLHHSPGLSQSPFPGGKQMLRYTMGYRDDCEMCRNKVAGHYGHVVHR